MGSQTKVSDQKEELGDGCHSHSPPSVPAPTAATRLCTKKGGSEHTHLHTQDTGSQFFSQMPSSHLVKVYLTATRPVIKNP